MTRTSDGAAFNLDGDGSSRPESPPGRTAPRAVRRQMRVRVRTTRGTSFTVNVSTRGVCTEQLRVLPVGTPVEGHISIDGRDAPFSGRIVWAVPGDPRLSLLGRMGLRFDRVDSGLARRFLER